MTSTKKRKKAVRHRGTTTHSRGGMKKARGKGHRGGIGKAGSGKKADHKKKLITDEGKKYFGKSKTIRRATKIKLAVLPLSYISDNLQSLEKKGLAKKSGEKYEITLPTTKILDSIEFKVKAKIIAKAASKAALETVKKAGGEIVLPAK
tara:strand:- start:1691 stop:2137 length:447 start_codon:yes stop_codon:yes gene_type:complete